MLSRQAEALWAKSDQGQEDSWLPLYQHMLDTGEVARLLWREWLAESVKATIAIQAGGPEAAEALVVWLAMGHDLGKATPGFEFKSPLLAERVISTGLAVPARVQHPPYHALMSQVILADQLAACGWDKSTATSYAIVAGGHHGAPPNPGDETRLRGAARNETLGDPHWHAVQTELARLAAAASGAQDLLDTWRTRPLPCPIQVILTGVVIVADWMASSADLLPLFPTLTDISPERRARAGWETLSLPPAWRAAPLPADATDLFGVRFDLPTTATIRPTQRALIEAAGAVAAPGLMILEAPMGSGKTEAALLAAEALASRFGLGGVAFLLPTMATSNAMFSRIKAWLSRLPDRRGPDQSQSLRLAHGKSALNPEFSRLPRWRPAGIGDEIVPSIRQGSPENVVAHAWLSGRKRSLLSNFVVGTVDQLLMAALKAKHVALRHLGLAGKVVIVDEVHAYDAFMSVYLERALEWLGAYHVPVILLSATLPPARREALLRAYFGHAGRRLAVPAAPRDETRAPAYPLLSTAVSNVVTYQPSPVDDDPTQVVIEELADTDDALVEELRQALTAGACIGVIRNTVTRAQRTFDLLQRELDCDIRLAHARFIACDRQAIDAEIVGLLGRNGKRPKRLVVVGTQVLEQSLDIDFDLLVTDIAPVDLMLQRLGRLHRHVRPRPAAVRQARCLVAGVDDWQACPPALNSGVSAVYPAALLLRTIAALRQRQCGAKVKVDLPTEIASLVEQVYEKTGEVPAAWEDALSRADDALARKQADQVGRAGAWLLGELPRRDLTGWLEADLSDADGDNARGQAAVRDSQDSIEVVVVQRDAGGTVRLLPWVAETEEAPPGEQPGARLRPADLADPELDEVVDRTGLSEVTPTLSHMNGLPLPETPLPLGRVIATDLQPDDETARLAAKCTVRLPSVLARPGLVDRVITALESQGGFAGWQQSRWLKGELPLVLGPDGTALLSVNDRQERRDFRLSYDRDRGLQLLRDERDSA